MIHLKQAIVVEGKYDRIRLSSIVDALVVETGGFRIYRDEKKCNLLRKLEKERGLIILTDSDAAGFQIRGFLRSIAGENADITEVYIPDLYGKEKRKMEASKEGKLGVEGMSEEILLSAFERAGVMKKSSKSKNPDPISQVDFYEWGLSGGKDSKNKREILLKKLDFPSYLTGKALINALNALYSKKNLEQDLRTWKII